MPDSKIQWHPGYQGGIEFRLRQYKDLLSYHHEHPLSKKPIIVDTLVIEKKDDVVIDEDIAAIFLRHGTKGRFFCPTYSPINRRFR